MRQELRVAHLEAGMKQGQEWAWDVHDRIEALEAAVAELSARLAALLPCWLPLPGSDCPDLTERTSRWEEEA